MVTKENLHHLVEELPDDAETLQKMRDLIVKELRLWDAAKRNAAKQERGAPVVQSRDSSVLVNPRRQGDDPVLSALMNASEEDENLSAEEQAALARAWARHQRAEGDYVSDEQLVRELGG